MSFRLVDDTNYFLDDQSLKRTRQNFIFFKIFFILYFEIVFVAISRCNTFATENND